MTTEPLLDELTKTHRQMQEACKYAESIVATVREPLLVLSGELRVISASRSFCRVFRVTPEETEGRFLFDLGGREWDIPALRRLLEEILPKHTTIEDFEVEHTFEGIGRRIMLLNARRIYPETNKEKRILLAIEDVTERRHAERAMQEARKYAESVVAAVREPLLVLNGELRVVWASPSFYQTFRVMPEETEGRLLDDLGNQEWDIPALRKLLEEILPQNAAMERYEVEQHFETIGRRVLLLNARRLYRDANKPEMILLAIEDATERRRAEKAIQEARNHLEAQVQKRTADLTRVREDSHMDSELRKQAEERANHLNLTLRAIRRVSQVTAHEKGRDSMLQRVCRTLVQECAYRSAWVVLLDAAGKLLTTAEAGLGDGFLLMLERLRRGQLPQCVQDSLARPELPVIQDVCSACTDCPFVHLHACKGGMIIRLAYAGQVYGVLAVSIHSERTGDEEEQALFRGVADDIAFALYGMNLETERRRHEEVLAQNAQDLGRSNAALEQFAYMVSHDLKSPLITIQGFAVHMAQDAEQGRVDRLPGFAKRVTEATVHMGQLIDDLLDFCRIGRVVNPPEPIAMTELIRDIATEHESALSESHVALEVQDDMPTINADRVRVTQVFDNLLTNALKHGRDPHEPRISIGAREEDNEVRFFVQDNGPGIPRQYHGKIFEMFVCLQSSIPGTGVGLAIVRQAVGVLGGRVWVESEPGQGATFWVAFPKELIEIRRPVDS